MTIPEKLQEMFAEFDPGYIKFSVKETEPSYFDVLHETKKALVKKTNEYLNPIGFSLNASSSEKTYVLYNNEADKAIILIDSNNYSNFYYCILGFLFSLSFDI